MENIDKNISQKSDIEKKKVYRMYSDLPKTEKIEYYLGDKLLGTTKTAEGSFSSNRIEDALSIGIKYYDRFIFISDKEKFPNSKDTDSLNYIIDGEPINDFKQMGKHGGFYTLED